MLVARFSEQEYNVDENGNVEVCVDLTFGIVEAGNLTINVANVLDTGSATCKITTSYDMHVMCMCYACNVHVDVMCM